MQRRRRPSPSSAAFAAFAAAALLAVAPARGGSLKVRDADGSQWRVVEDPADDAQGYVLQRLGRDGKLDPHFGRGGQRPVSISATNDGPTSLRVDGTYRVWMAGASIAGDQPQAVVERFQPDGTVDLHWGVQGKVQLSPGGLAIKPNDLLPLADGSVLVAGVAANLEPTRAVVFHLKADGSLDTAFGSGGTWQRAGASDGSTATSLGASSEGAVAVAVAARGDNAAAEIWSLADGPAKLIRQRPLDEGSDGEDVRLAWAGDHWSFDTAGGPTIPVAPAFLGVHPRASGAAAVAASDPGQGAFNPFSAEPASAAPSREPVDEGSSWPWIAGVAALCAALVGGLRVRGRGTRTVLKAGPRR
jgi:uncharacterized delta-60 repeat protein